MKPLLLSLLCSLSLAGFSQSYQAIHNNAIVIDTHNDVLSEVIMKGMNIDVDLTGKAHSDIARFKKGGVDVQIFSVFCDERFGKDAAFKYANIEIDSLYNIIKRNKSRMMLVTNPAQLQQAVKGHNLGCMIGVEGGHMIEDRLDYLDSLYKRGARYLTLTWNNSTSWATSAMEETKKKDSLAHKGLSELGKTIVKRMNQLGMLVDVSHVGEQTFCDAINTSTKPVIASHSGVYALCPVFRNLKNDQIKAIGKNGGVIHVNFFSGFIDTAYNNGRTKFWKRHQEEVDSLKNNRWPNYDIEQYLAKKYAAEVEAYRPTLSQLIDHIDYIVKLIGVDHVGLGSDFDGIESAPKTLDDVSSFPLITKALLERGYSKKEVEKILGGNFIRVFKANQKNL
ncbi:MAG: membrane dipeptidase [Chitinophagaceae bacterium]